ncbi:MAG: porin [Acidobacteriota bacterium]|nr:porin [Acidobacteriota bacterium]
MPSKCWFGILLASVLCRPTFAQNASPAVNSGPPAAAAQPPATARQQVARTVEDIRERILLDRVEQLEKRLAELEARDASAATAPAAAATAPATTPAAQDTAAAQTSPAAAAPASPTWSIGPIDFSGLVDGYYSFNANHPADQGSCNFPAACGNQLYNFDVQPNQFSLNMAKLSLSHSPDPIGFQVDFGFGRAFDIVHASEPGNGPAVFRNIEQAYVSLKPAKAKGLEVDFGQFVTSAGAEVIETNSNWNYSRSLLFAWAIPYYHFGIRTSIPIGKYFSGGVQIVNGWNNIEDNNSGKTIGLTGVFTTKKFVWSNNYYAGPENSHANSGWRHLYDTNFLLTLRSTISAYINFDYAQNSSPSPNSFASKWYGIAGALHVQATPKFAFTPRLEWFKDRDGFSTGVPQDVKEFTITGEYKMLEGLLGRLEYRHDWSNQPFFNRGLDLAVTNNQDTLTAGFVAFFGPKR